MRLAGWLVENAGLVVEYGLAHIWLTLLPTAIGVCCSLALGYVASTYKRSYGIIVGGTSLFYTIPSLAVFILLPAILGIRILNPLNVVIALTIYTIALMTRVVADSLNSVSTRVIDAASGIGLSNFQILYKVKLPIAIPSIISGLRVVIVSNISIVTMAAIVGIVQLGTFFTMGFTRRLFIPIIVGLIVCTIMSFAADRALLAISRLLTPWEQSRKS